MRSSHWLSRLSSSLLRAIRAKPRGEGSWTTYLLLVAIVGGGYVVAAYAPLYLDNYNAKAKCGEVVAKTWRYKDESRTRDYIRAELSRIALEDVIVDGVMKKVSAIQPKEHELQVEIDSSVIPPMLRVRVDYDRVVRFPFIKKEKTKHFVMECEIEIDQS